MIKIEDLRALGVDELQEKASLLRRELMNYRFQLRTGKLEQQMVIENTRRDIARILTIMNEKKKGKES